MEKVDLDALDPNPPSISDYEKAYTRMYSLIVARLEQNCGACANWLQLDRAPNAGWCRIASGERTTHAGTAERYGLMTTDLQVCSQWMERTIK